MSFNRPILYLSIVVLTACSLPSRSGGGGGGGGDQTERDIAGYVSLQIELDQGNTEFLGNVADELHAAGNHLFWLEFRGWDPTLHGWNAETDQRVNYSFSIGGGDRWSYRTSRNALATAEEGFDQITYHVWDIDAPDTEITTAVFDAPTDEQRWWAYAVHDTTLYVVTTGEVTTLYRVPAGGTPEAVTTLESAGCNVEIFMDFDVEGGTMIFIESGRIWRLDLPSNTATWLGNETEISGSVNFAQDGVIFESARGPFFYVYETHELIDLEAEIQASGYQINETFASSHLYDQDIWRYRDWMVYIGSSGVFAYHLYEGEVRPLLLEPRSEEVRIEYRYPVVLENGLLFVTGLTSTSGSVGADGPVYSVDISGRLQ
jgi:hypothetical protein